MFFYCIGFGTKVTGQFGEASKRIAGCLQEAAGIIRAVAGKVDRIDKPQNGSRRPEGGMVKTTDGIQEIGGSLEWISRAFRKRVDDAKRVAKNLGAITGPGGILERIEIILRKIKNQTLRSKMKTKKHREMDL